MRVQTVNPAAYYTCNEPGAHKLPNAATRRYIFDKIIDGLLAAAITVATVVVLIVLITM